MKKASPVILSLLLMLFFFGCKEKEPLDDGIGNPLEFSNFPTCSGSQLTGSGTLHYTIYTSEDDWMTSANALSSGAIQIPTEVVIPELQDGIRYFYDIQLGDRDNWYGGNIAASTLNNYSFIYREKGLNPLLPKLFFGQSDVIGTYMLRDVKVAGSSILMNLDSCVHDNYLVINKSFIMQLNEGANVCSSSSASESFAFFYQNCDATAPDILEDYESSWTSKPGNEKITFEKVNNLSQLTLEVLSTTGLREYIYIRQ
ncbi:MAG TPA: hypothetical protein ENJ82_07015 [Bacteroidetes bacterium]|nr:hypothetical protein [Bacteroidota bacterium]